MLIIYSFLLFLVLVLGLPYWLVLMAINGKYREGLSERLGWVPKRLRAEDERQTIWVHAVSVGEVLAASRLVNELAARTPQYRVLFRLPPGPGSSWPGSASVPTTASTSHWIFPGSCAATGAAWIQC